MMLKSKVSFKQAVMSPDGSLSLFGFSMFSVVSMVAFLAPVLFFI